MNKVVKISLIATMVLFGVSGCNLPWQKSKANAQAQQKMPPMPVGVFEAKKADVPVKFEFPANIVSEQNVNIVAKVSGTLVEKYVKAGDVVKKGDKLFLIEPDKYKAAYDNAKAALNVANATLAQSELEYKRTKKLKATNAISQKEFDTSVANYKIALAKVESAQAALNNAKIDLDYTEVTAPFDGVVGDPLKDVGSYISPSDANLIRLTKLDPIFADFAISDVEALNINEKLASKAWEQTGANAVLSVGGRDYNGSVTFIDKVVNEKTGSVDAKAEFKNDKFEILPGSFGRIVMSGLVQKGGYKIPSVAVQQDLTSPYVYIIKDGKVAKKIIKIVYEEPKFVVVSDGLEDGDKIIVDNFVKIRLGAPVMEASEFAKMMMAAQKAGKK